MLTPGYALAHFDEVAAMGKRQARGDRLLDRDAEAIMRWDHALYRQWVSDQEVASIDAPALIVGIDANIGNAGPTIEMARLLHEKLPRSHLVPLEGARALVLLEARNDSWPRPTRSSRPWRNQALRGSPPSTVRRQSRRPAPARRGRSGRRPSVPPRRPPGSAPTGPRHWPRPRPDCATRRRP
jgi:hypothetical protein